MRNTVFGVPADASPGRWVSRQQSDGQINAFWEASVMARIPDEFIGCVFFLYPSRHDADVGSELGATGFFVGSHWSNNPNRFHVYAVTNKHCIMTCRDQVVIRATTIHGNLDFIESDPGEWHPSPAHDLSVLPLSLERSLLFQHVTGRRFVTPDEFKEDKAKPTCLGPGDKVFMIGRFISHDGKTVNHPSARFGNLSMLPAPIKQPGGHQQESFAVEMRSISGYSGSPVFIYWEFGGGHLEGIRRTMIHSYLGFLGVDWGHIPMRLPVLDPKTNKPVPDKLYVKSHTSISGVVPAWHLMDLLNTQKLKDQRMQDEHDQAEKERENPPAELDFAREKSVPDSEENPRGLEDFKRLVDVAARKRPQGDQT